MIYEQIVQQQLHAFADRLIKEKILFIIPAGICIYAYAKQWHAPNSPQEDWLEFKGNVGFFNMLLQWHVGRALHDTWNSGEDTIVKERNFLFMPRTIVAIQRQGVVVAIAADDRTLKEVKKLAEEFCNAVLADLKTQA